MRRVAVVGLGLIGGSVALAARSLGFEVVGCDRAGAAAEAALRVGAVNHIAGSPVAAAGTADLVVVCVPVDVIPGVLTELRSAARPGVAVTDVGSAKTEVVAAGVAVFGDGFVGGHPMAGSERHGIEAADPRLFEDAHWLLTPTPATSEDAYRSVRDFVTALGARAVAVDPATHDALVARLSHVPQLTASALVDVAATAEEREALLGLAAGGFRDVTRIAASNPDLWVAILRSNRDAVAAALDGLRGRLDDVAGMVADGRWEDVRAFLAGARRARVELFARPDMAGDPVLLTLLVPDRPGLLAEVTTAAGRLGANIEDLRIFHSTEGGRGRLELVVSGEERAARLAAALTDLGYRVEQMPPGVEVYG